MDRTPEPGFSEREFYLREFRGRTLAVALPRGEDPTPLAEALDALTGSGTRVVLVAAEREPVQKLVEGRWLDAAEERLEAEAWRALRAAPRLGIAVDPALPFLRAVRELALRLGVFKLVLVDPAGGLVREDGVRLSFVDLVELRGLLKQQPPLAGRREPFLREVRGMLLEGIPAVNVCTAAGLADELFTWGGSGTLFTRKRYVSVRRLGLDDYDAAADLLERGVEEGFLVPRPTDDLDRILACGFGAFVEGRYLAGIGSLLPHPGSDAGEIASLYAITRFLGEGVGMHLVAFALERARRLRLGSVFACTTSERVGAFFTRQDFQRVTPDALPESKWDDYDPERRARLLCFRREIGPASAGGARSEP
ncbi:MAG TPA: GNAT family N-acetyltransferase [Myxococcota bacterium]|nr:GNAT family N-acetyltransferase [Myxococcota bacterium]